MRVNRLGKALTIFFAAYVILLIFFAQFGPFYVKLLQGVFRWEINSFFHPLKVSSLGVETYHGQSMIFLEARLSENLRLPDGTLLHTIGRPYTARTISINMYLHPIIAFSILAAWPGILLRDRFKVFLLALPLLLIVEMVDIPLLLATRINEVIQAELYKDPLAGSGAGSYWAAFLHTGGRAALSILAIGLAFACFYGLRFRREQGTAAEAGAGAKTDPPRLQPGRNAPCPCGSGKKYKHCCASK